MRNIPTSFKLIGRQYTVKRMEAVDAETMDGRHSIADALIELAPCSKQHQMATFGHELCHALFEAAGREDLSSDEALVDILGNLLHQFWQSKRGKLT